MKVYPQFKLFSFDDVDSYHGDFCMPALPFCDHVFKYLENYFYFLGDDCILDCLHCGSCKFILIWNVQSHADDVVGCNSLALLPLQTDFENSHQGSLYYFC